MRARLGFCQTQARVLQGGPEQALALPGRQPVDRAQRAASGREEFIDERLLERSGALPRLATGVTVEPPRFSVG